METKICNKCGIEKPISSFYFIKRTGKYHGKCKACFITMVVESQRKNWEKHKAYKRKLYREHHDKELARKLPTNPAHSATVKARKNGDIIIPDACEECGKKIKLESHHYNGYTPEHHLDVRWLCSRCHGLAHSKYAEERKKHPYSSFYFPK